MISRFKPWSHRTCGIRHSFY